MTREKVIIMFPTWPEARPFMDRYGGDFFVAKAGIGPAECAARTARLIAEQRPRMMILAGIAGAYPGHGIGKGDTVLVVRENCSSLGTMRGTDFLPLPKSSPDPADNYYDCLTPLPDIFPKVVSNSIEIAGTGHHNPLLTEAAVENMEGAAFFAVCNSLDIPFAEIRSISNYVGEEPGGWIIPQATESLAGHVMSLIRELGF